MIPIPLAPNRAISAKMARAWRPGQGPGPTQCQAPGSPVPIEDAPSPSEKRRQLELTELFHELVHELYRRARYMRGRYGQNCSWQTGDVVHEAYLRVQRADRGSWDSRDHFLVYASKVMRSFLVDQYRKKRNRRLENLPHDQDLDSICADFEEHGIDLEAIDQALHRLAEDQPLMAKAVELRFFLGEEMTDIARILNIPKRTLERRWRAVRAWLRTQIPQ